MGLTIDSGQTVHTLPYAEGQVLSTLADDWRGLRVPPLTRTFGASLVRALDAGNFSVARLTAGADAVEILYFALGVGTVAFKMRAAKPADAVLTTVVGIGVTQLTLPTPAPGVLANASASLSTGLVSSFGTSFLPSTDFGKLPPSRFPRLWILPGDSMLWAGQNINTAMVLDVVWREVVGDDALTAGISG
jgi:hypothetical protein